MDALALISALSIVGWGLIAWGVWRLAVRFGRGGREGTKEDDLHERHRRT